MNDGGPAFPTFDWMVHSNGDQLACYGPAGLSLRDYFAAASLTGNLTVFQGTNPKDGETWDQMIARYCYETADAMIAERAKGGE